MRDAKQNVWVRPIGQFYYDWQKENQWKINRRSMSDQNHQTILAICGLVVHSLFEAKLRLSLSSYVPSFWQPDGAKGMQRSYVERAAEQWAAEQKSEVQRGAEQRGLERKGEEQRGSEQRGA